MYCCYGNSSWSTVRAVVLSVFLLGLAGCPLVSRSASSLDADGDGILAAEDACPDTPAEAQVDDAGCAASQRDSDGDGVSDDRDDCADTPAEENVDAMGCPVAEPETPDADGDGVPDDLDQCPDTPMGASVDPNGCTENEDDRDGDGILDDVDQCDATPAGATVDELGCAASQRDSDGDSVHDALDECPNTPSGVTVDTLGCEASAPDLAPPDEIATSWNVSGDVLFVGVLEPRTYNLTADGVLIDARVTLSDQLTADPETTVFTESVPLAVPTTLATAVIDDASSGPVLFAFAVLFDWYAVHFDSDGSLCSAGSVCWEFDITISTESDLAGGRSTSSTRYKGVQTGTLSSDGKTVTWMEMSGTRVITTSLGDGFTERTITALEDAFDSVSSGLWTQVE